MDLGWVHSAFGEPAFTDSDQNTSEKYSDFFLKNPLKYIHWSHRVKKKIKKEINFEPNKYMLTMKKRWL